MNSTRYGWWSYQSFLNHRDLNQCDPEFLDPSKNQILLPLDFFTKKDGSYAVVWQLGLKKEVSGSWDDLVFVGEVVDFIQPEDVDPNKAVAAISEVEELYRQKYGKKINLLAEAGIDLNEYLNLNSQRRKS